MAKKKSKKATASKGQQKQDQQKQQERIVTIEALQEMSSDDEEGVFPAEDQLEGQAKELYKAIKSGAFDELIRQVEQEEGDDDESIEEVELNDDSSSNGVSEDAAPVDDDADEVDDGESEAEDDDDEEESDHEEDRQDVNDDEGEGPLTVNDDDDDTSGEEDEPEMMASDSDDDDANNDMQQRNASSSKALLLVTQEIQDEKKGMPWAEIFAVTPSTSLPFGEADEDGEKINIHDDLKREVIFHDVALEAALKARDLCREANIPFTRPDDFYAEMVKTDDHMAKIKDRLIFENKKIEAVAQRKANKEHKLRAKESHAHKVAEKAKRKRDHMAAVDEFAKSQRGAGRLMDDADDKFLQSMKKGPNKKRLAADKKYGFGGPRPRFKQNDRATLNSPKGYNPRGHFEGGMKRSSQAAGSGGKRQGKRARSASRSRR